MLERLRTTFTADDQQYVFDNIGTNPAMLIKLAEDDPNFMTLSKFSNSYSRIKVVLKIVK